MTSVSGFAPAVSGQQPPSDVPSGSPIPVGVWGDSSTGVGVFGSSGPPPLTDDKLPWTAGVYGRGTEGPGTEDESGPTPGVVGVSPNGVGSLGWSKTGWGIAGSTESSEWPAVGGWSDGSYGVAGHGVVWGASGYSENGTGLYGLTDSGVGAYGECRAGDSTTEGDLVGVYGSCDVGTGVCGISDQADGVVGITNGEGSGVFGLHFSGDPGSGVFGESVVSSGVEGYSFSQDADAAAIRGENRHGHAGLFVGEVKVVGTLHKSGGGFLIDHPRDPQNKYLRHSFVESPDMLNVYSGTTTTNHEGFARVTLPDYFEALNRDFRYQLTAIGQFAQLMVAEEIHDNEFVIRSSIPNVKVSWQVTGIRRDVWAEAHRIQVEQDKPDTLKGHLLHPEFVEDAPSIHGCGRPSDVPVSLHHHLRNQADVIFAAADANATNINEMLSDAGTSTGELLTPRNYHLKWTRLLRQRFPGSKPSGSG